MGKLDVEEYGTYDSMVATLLEHKFLPEKEVLQLCERARSLISEESNVHSVRAPVTVVGDIHGQFTTCWRCSRSAETRRTRTTSSWATTSIAGTTRSRRSRSSSR